MIVFSILSSVMWGQRTFKLTLFSFVFVGTLFSWYVVFAEDRRGELTFAVLDIGQGDALFIEAPNGNQMLVDGGPTRVVLERLADEMPFYDKTIDLVGLSHPHRDHMDGLIDVLKRYRVGSVVTSGTDSETPQHDAFELVSTSSILVLHRGDRIFLGGGAFIDVLFPVADSSEVSPHQGMLVMLLQYGDTSFLLTGDMEKNIEQFLATLDGKNLKVDVLKVGHHGSETSTSDALLGVTRPRFAVISSGEGNSFGHPKQEVLDRLTEAKVEIHRTDIEGTVVFKSDGRTVWVEE